MKLDLNPRQVKLLDTLLGLDLEAMGLNRGQQRVAHSIHTMLHPVPRPKSETMEAEPREIGLRVLRLTPSYRHSDK
jgi:hypothetical protein